MPVAKISIAGMSSRSDEERIEAALKSEPGIFGAIANRDSGCGEIDYEDDEVALERILEIVRSAGFEAKLAG